MSFSFCFSPMRRAALFALASSLGQGGGKTSFLAAVAFVAGNAFSFLVFVVLAAGNAFSFFGVVAFGTGNAFSFLPFVVFGTGNAFSFWLCGIRYRRGPPTVRNTNSVLKTGSWGTRRIFRGIRCKKQAFPVQDGY